MIQYLKCSVATLIAILSVTLTSCVNKDNQFGNSLIPPGQAMEIVIDSNTVVPQTFIYALDSIATSGTSSSVKYVGSLIDPYVGRTNMQFFSHFAPVPTFNMEELTYFGKDATADSLKITLSFSGYSGDTTVGTKINMYEVKHTNFVSKSTYFSNFKMDKYVDSKPLATFNVKSPINNVVALPKEFAERLLINTQDRTNPYYADTAFLKLFKGLYFESQPAVAGAKGVAYGVNLGSTYLRLYYHNKNEKADTTHIDFVLKANYYALWNVAFQMVQHDYSYADPAKGGVKLSEIGDSVNQSKFGYVQGVAGLGTNVVILDSQIEILKRKVKDAGYKGLAIQAAELVFKVEDPTWQNYNAMFSQLVTYYSLSPLLFSPDYNPVQESTETIGGRLNRSVGTYSLNISRYIQALVNGTITQKKKLQIEPALTEYLSTISRSVIKGSASDTPPKLIITYTMLK